MPKTPDDLFKHLDAIGVETTTVSHPPLYTVEQSQTLRGEIAGGHTKNLFLKDKKGSIFLVVALESATIDLKSLHSRIGASGRLSFGKPDLLMQKLGVEPGSVTPFGVINDDTCDVTVILDAPMMDDEVLNFHPLVNTSTTSIGRDDLLAFLRSCGHEPKIMHVSAQP